MDIDGAIRVNNVSVQAGVQAKEKAEDEYKDDGASPNS